MNTDLNSYNARQKRIVIFKWQKQYVILHSFAIEFAYESAAMYGQMVEYIVSFEWFRFIFICLPFIGGILFDAHKLVAFQKFI